MYLFITFLEKHELIADISYCTVCNAKTVKQHHQRIIPISHKHIEIGQIGRILQKDRINRIFQNNISTNSLYCIYSVFIRHLIVL